jgi:large subunit ribosomal protein L29
MKATQVHEMTNEELNAKLIELKADLFKLRFNHATGQLNNPMLIPDCKRDIARVKTELRDREIKGITGPVKAVIVKPVKARGKKA